MPRVTKDYFAFYKKEIKFWMKYLGLTSWDCFFTHTKDENNLAAVLWDRENGNVTFYLATTWGKKHQVNEETISLSAFHEVCELLLSELRTMGNFFVKSSEVNRAVHEIICRLENTVFEYEWNRRIS